VTPITKALKRKVLPRSIARYGAHSHQQRHKDKGRKSRLAGFNVKATGEKESRTVERPVSKRADGSDRSPMRETRREEMRDRVFIKKKEVKRSGYLILGILRSAGKKGESDASLKRNCAGHAQVR